jgi:hypothetical protein
MDFLKRNFYYETEGVVCVCVFFKGSCTWKYFISLVVIQLE